MQIRQQPTVLAFAETSSHVVIHRGRAISEQRILNKTRTLQLRRRGRFERSVLTTSVCRQSGLRNRTVSWPPYGLPTALLAMPILAGLGTIATAMNYASGGTLTEFVITIFAFVVPCVITQVLFLSGERLVKYIGGNCVKVMMRLMSLTLGVLGVQMLIHRVGGAVTAFSAS